MTYKKWVSLVGATAMYVCAVGAAGAQQREMNVRQGPETIFERPVAEIMAELSGAEATGENGRVGNEFAFWGYKLADDRQVFFFACAMVRGINCDRRTRLACLGGGTLIRSAQVRAKVRHVNCPPVAFIAVGDVRRGCAETDIDSDLEVGLIQCN